MRNDGDAPAAFAMVSVKVEDQMTESDLPRGLLAHWLTVHPAIERFLDRSCVSG